MKNKRGSVLSVIAFLIAIIVIVLVTSKVLTFSVERTSGVEVRKVASDLDYAFNAPESITMIHAFPGNYFKGCGIGAVMFDVDEDSNNNAVEGSYIGISRCGETCIHYFNIMQGFMTVVLGIDSAQTAASFLPFVNALGSIPRKSAEEEVAESIRTTLKEWAEEDSEKVAKSSDEIAELTTDSLKNSPLPNSIESKVDDIIKEEGLENVPVEIISDKIGKSMKDIEAAVDDIPSITPTIKDETTHAIVEYTPKETAIVLKETSDEMLDQDYVMATLEDSMSKSMENVFVKKGMSIEEAKVLANKVIQSLKKAGVIKKVAKATIIPLKITHKLFRWKAAANGYLRLVATGQASGAVQRGVLIDVGNKASGGWFREKFLGLPSPATYLGACCFKTSYASRLGLEVAQAGVGYGTMIVGNLPVAAFFANGAQVVLDSMMMNVYRKEFMKCREDREYYKYIQDTNLKVEARPKKGDFRGDAGIGPVILHNYINSPKAIIIKKQVNSNIIEVRGI